MMTDTSGRDKTEWSSDTHGEFDTNDTPTNEIPEVQSHVEQT